MISGKPFIVVLLAIGIVGTALANAAERLPLDLAPGAYSVHVGKGARVVPAGDLKIDGRSLRCGSWPTVLDPNLNDYGAAFPRFIVLNPKLLAKIPTPSRLYVFAHECGHLFSGPDEVKADCYAVQSGKSAGWLTPTGLDQVCAFIRPGKADATHFAGAKRCAVMRKCYAEGSPPDATASASVR